MPEPVLIYMNVVNILKTKIVNYHYFILTYSYFIPKQCFEIIVLFCRKIHYYTKMTQNISSQFSAYITSQHFTESQQQRFRSFQVIFVSSSCHVYNVRKSSPWSATALQ